MVAVVRLTVLQCKFRISKKKSLTTLRLLLMQAHPDAEPVVSVHLMSFCKRCHVFKQKYFAAITPNHVLP